MTLHLEPRAHTLDSRNLLHPKESEMERARTPRREFESPDYVTGRTDTGSHHSGLRDAKRAQTAQAGESASSKKTK
jgi:hypothetical protein